jgi:hypothetical protein
LEEASGLGGFCVVGATHYLLRPSANRQMEIKFAIYCRRKITGANAATLKVPTSVAGQKRRFERLSASSGVYRKADGLKATPDFA